MRKQSIKAAVVLLLAFMLLASIPAPSYAEEGTSVYISDLDLSIVVPSGFDIFTREIAADDYLFTKYGITHDQLLTMMEAQNSYLDAISVDNLSELTIIRFDSIFSDFDTMSDNSLIALGSVLKELFSSSDVIIEHDGVYSHSQVKFVKFAVRTEADGEIQTLMYTTSFGGNMISFTLQSYSGTEISSAQESTIKQFVDSALFGPIPPTTSVQNPSESFVYYDEEAMIHFTVPANWKEEALSKERQYIKAKFVTDQELGLSILYGCEDAWASLTAEEKSFLPRYFFNMSTFSKTDIAKELGIPENQLDTVVYNEQQYYRTEIVTEAMGLSIETTVVFCIHNGYIYHFQFSGTTSDKYYKDFESLLGSVKYENLYGSKPFFGGDN